MNSSRSRLKVVRMTINATLPSRASPESAGLDLYSAYNYVIAPGTRRLVKTDLQIVLPVNTYGRIAPRSGLALHCSVDVVAGVVDSDYRGNIGILLANNGTEHFEVRRGDRVAQLICEKIMYPVLVEVSEIDGTVRGCSGFGSSGK